MIKHCTQANVCLFDTKEECRAATRAWRQSQEGLDYIMAKARQMGHTQGYIDYFEQEYPKV